MSFSINDLRVLKVIDEDNTPEPILLFAKKELPNLPSEIAIMITYAYKKGFLYDFLLVVAAIITGNIYHKKKRDHNGFDNSSDWLDCVIAFKNLEKKVCFKGISKANLSQEEFDREFHFWKINKSKFFAMKREVKELRKIFNKFCDNKHCSTLDQARQAILFGSLKNLYVSKSNFNDFGIIRFILKPWKDYEKEALLDYKSTVSGFNSIFSGYAKDIPKIFQSHDLPKTILTDVTVFSHEDFLQISAEYPEACQVESEIIREDFFSYTQVFSISLFNKNLAKIKRPYFDIDFILERESFPHDVAHKAKLVLELLNTCHQYDLRLAEKKITKTLEFLYLDYFDNAFNQAQENLEFYLTEKVKLKERLLKVNQRRISAGLLEYIISDNSFYFPKMGENQNKRISSWEVETAEKDTNFEIEQLAS